MTEIEALLARLKELDRETWERYQTICRDHLIMYSFGPDELPGWVLQGAVQDAIAAPWFWGIQKMVIDGTYGARVWHITRTPGPCWGVSNSPAEALLRAYIKALEAQR